MNLYTKKLVDFIKKNPKKDNSFYCQNECYRCNFASNGCMRQEIEAGVEFEAAGKPNVNNFVIRQEAILRVNAHLRELSAGWIDVIEKLKFLENLK
jgi:hypothetical protein